RVAILAPEGEPVAAELLGLGGVPPAAAAAMVAVAPSQAGPMGTLAEMERHWILRALREAGGRRGIAAERLDISPRTLRYKLAEYRDAGIPIEGAGDEEPGEGGEAEAPGR